MSVMSVGHTSSAKRTRDRQPAVRWCPQCRDLQHRAGHCPRCPGSTAPSVALVRGLASIELADEHGLLHYRGERTTRIIGLSLILMIPLAAAVALAANLTGLATALLSASFIGLPTLAFIDAQRAGAGRGQQLDDMPTSAPELPGTDADTPGRGILQSGPIAVYRGRATIASKVVAAPLSEESCLSYRLDIRAGADAELVARYTSDNEFSVTCADGTQVLIAGVVELTARQYTGVQTTERAAFSINGTDLLPALFSRGGWACQLLIAHDDQIQVQGAISGELRNVALGGSYRQSGAVEVLRGTPGHPVVVSLLQRQSA